jgi:hypothetical protein
MRIETTNRATPAFPNLFGRITAAGHDHVHLDALLQRLEHLSDALDAGGASLPWALQPTRLLNNLQAQLAHHFDAEEAAGYFGTIARERPETLPAIVELKADHRTLLAEVTDLMVIAGHLVFWSELSVRVRRLIASLRAHEQAESALAETFLREPAQMS